MAATSKPTAPARSQRRKRRPWRRWLRAAAPAARIPIVYRAYEWVLAQGGDDGPTVDEHGAPAPNAYLRVLVTGHKDLKGFLRTGAETVAEFAEMFERAGAPLSQMERLLDFGCGCGRLARHLPRYTTATIEGFDVNPRLVRWCATHLPGRYGVCRLRPPLSAADGRYDGAIGFSVLTHLRADTQRAWCAELARVARPGAVFALTFHDEHHPLCDARVKAALARDGFALARRGGEGSNGLASFQTDAWARAMFAQHFEIVEIVDSTRVSFKQAVAVVRRPAAA